MYCYTVHTARKRTVMNRRRGSRDSRLAASYMQGYRLTRQIDQPSLKDDNSEANGKEEFPEVSLPIAGRVWSAFSY